MNPRLVRTASRIISDRTAVLVPLPVAGAYDYRVPEGMELAPGRFVRVPLGVREVTGVVWGGPDSDIDEAKLRDVIAPLDVPPLPADLLRTVAWTASYTMTPPGAVLRMAMSVPDALDPPRVETAYVLEQSAARDGVRLTAARERVLDFLANGRACRAAEIARATGSGAAVVRGLVERGLVRAVSIEPGIEVPLPDWRRQGPALNPAQDAAAMRLRQQIAAGTSDAVTLLDGITGSGKTEVYFEAIAAALARRRQVLVLLPEIALTVDWLRRFEARFGAPPLHWHSDVSGARRRETWRAVSGGKARVVVGARSALFLPFPDLGLIVVDEEHDSSFKQEDGVIYNARDIAIVRARHAACPIVLASATPTLETVVNVRRGRYERIVLPERFGGAAVPEIAAIDMRAQSLASQTWLSPSLREAVSRTLGAGEQALLFLNRRGYAPLTLCRGCGHRIACVNCSAWLVDHRLTRRLQCHHCGFATQPPETCPHCGAEDAFVPCGPGVERLMEESAIAFPGARTALISSDALRSASAAEALIGGIRRHDFDIVIGTQLVAKGHNFPHLTLVGVVDADLGLDGGDLRAAERSFQVLHQVAGRAGRASRPGRALVQTYNPDHPVMAALVAGDRDGFLDSEARARESYGMPPFGRLAGIVVSGRNEPAVDAACRALGRAAPRGAEVRILGPAPAPLALVRGRHRRRFLVKAPQGVRIQPVIERWLRQIPTRRGVRVHVDIDPYSFL